MGGWGHVPRFSDYAKRFGVRRLDAALESLRERQLEITPKTSAGKRTAVGSLELACHGRAKRRRAAALQSASRAFVHT